MIEDSEFIPWNENYRWHHQGALGAEQPPKNERAADVERCLALLVSIYIITRSFKDPKICRPSEKKLVFLRKNGFW